MIICAVDPAEKNFAVSVWEEKKGFVSFKLIDVRKIKGDMPEKVVELQRRGLFDACDVLLIERQMRSRFKCMAAALKVLNIEKSKMVAPQSVKRHFATGNKGKGAYRANKKSHVELARKILSGKRELVLFEKFKKKDDIADCVVMTQWYLEKYL